MVGILNSKFLIDCISNLLGKLLTFLSEISVKIATSKKKTVFFKNLILWMKKNIKHKNRPLKIPKSGAFESLKISEGIRKIIGK